MLQRAPKNNIREQREKTTTKNFIKQKKIEKQKEKIEKLQYSFEIRQLRKLFKGIKYINGQHKPRVSIVGDIYGNIIGDKNSA